MCRGADLPQQSYLHHLEYDENPIGVEKIKKIVEEKKMIYDHKADQRENKFNSKEMLKIEELNKLPNYISSNIEKYKAWIEIK